MPGAGGKKEAPVAEGSSGASASAGSDETTAGGGLLHGLAIATLCVAYLGVIVGGIVTSTESGRVDKNWPSFDGNLLPSPGGMLDNPGLLVEHGHRLMMASVGFLALLACLAAFKMERRPRVKLLSLVVVALVLPPAILGGLTVLYKLPPILSVLHVGMAMLFISAVTILAGVTSPGWIGEKTRLKLSKADPICSLALFAVLSIYVQIVLGAVPRHATLEPGGGGEALQTIGDLVHIVWAFAVFTGIVLLVGKVLSLSKADRILHPSLGLLLLLFLQVFLGFATFIYQTPPSLVVDEAPGLVKTGTFETLASVHQAVGVLILILAVVVCARAYRIRFLSASEPGAAL